MVDEHVISVYGKLCAYAKEVDVTGRRLNMR
jgi:hypothetical protein